MPLNERAEAAFEGLYQDGEEVMQQAEQTREETRRVSEDRTTRDSSLDSQADKAVCGIYRNPMTFLTEMLAPSNRQVQPAPFRPLPTNWLAGPLEDDSTIDY